MVERSLVLSGSVLAHSGVVAECGLTLPDGLPFAEWAAVGGLIGRIRRASLWWVGDWLNYGERVYGESYAQAMDATGLDYGTLRNAAWVASRFPLSRRRDNLSFAHHQAVAPLLPENQQRWLDAAAPEPGEDKPHLTVAALRVAVAAPSVPATTGDKPPPWVIEHCRRIQGVAQQVIDGGVSSAAGADMICAEAMRIRERAAK